MKLFRASAFAQSGNYNPALDGLRFVAFLLVFIHHAPKLNGFMAAVKRNGWMGVDLFFVISAFLLLSNLIREDDRTGSVNVGNYFLRRFLRIYPLMAFYVLAMLVYYGPNLPDWPLHLAGVLLFFDNLLSWHFDALNNSIQAANHLWTLSFEFQVYAVLPALLFAYLKFGRRVFLSGLVVAAVLAALARWWLYHKGLSHPQVYVTPLFRPEAIFAGLFLAVYRPVWHWGISAAGAIGAAVLAIYLPRPWESELSAIVGYPVIALAAGAAVDCALRASPVKFVLSLPPIVYLGTISYGLYVYHYAVREQLSMWQRQFGFRETGTVWQWLPFTASLLILTIAIASLSYFLLEKPFLRLKPLDRRANSNADSAAR